MSSVVSMSEYRESGFTQISNIVTDALCRHTLTSRQFRVVMAVIRLTFGYQKDVARITGETLHKATGIKRQHCSVAVSELLEMGVLIRRGSSRGPIGVNKKIEEWSNVKREKPSPIEKLSDPNLGSVNTVIQDRVSDPNLGSVSDPNLGSHINKTYKQTNTTTDVVVQKPPSSEPEKPKPKFPPCPAQKIIDLYHEHMPHGSRVVKRDNKTLLQHIGARWREQVELPDAEGNPQSWDCCSLKFWERYFKFCSQSAFLRGEIAPRPGSRYKQFRASLAWLVNPTNMEKVLNGEYVD